MVSFSISNIYNTEICMCVAVKCVWANFVFVCVCECVNNTHDLYFVCILKCGAFANKQTKKPTKYKRIKGVQSHTKEHRFCGYCCSHANFVLCPAFNYLSVFFSFSVTSIFAVEVAATRRIRCKPSISFLMANFQML